MNAEVVLEEYPGTPWPSPFDPSEPPHELAHTVPCVPPCATSGGECANPYMLPLSVETREIRQLRAELDEWCAKVRRLDVPLPLYTDKELEEACVPLDKLRWDIPKRDRRALNPRSDDLIPLACEGPLSGLIPQSIYSGDTRP